MSRAPIGWGGKIDDTSVVVGEVVEYTAGHAQMINSLRRQRKMQKFFGCFTRPFAGGCGGAGGACGRSGAVASDMYIPDEEEVEQEEEMTAAGAGSGSKLMFCI